MAVPADVTCAMVQKKLGPLKMCHLISQAGARVLSSDIVIFLPEISTYKTSNPNEIDLDFAQYKKVCHDIKAPIHIHYIQQSNYFTVGEQPLRVNVGCSKILNGSHLLFQRRKRNHTYRQSRLPQKMLLKTNLG